MTSKTFTIAFTTLFIWSFNVCAESSCYDLLKAGKSQEAVTSAQQSLKTKPKQIDEWHCLGRAHSAQGQFQEGLNALTQAKNISAAPTDLIMTHIHMGNIHIAQQLYAQAIEHYQASLNLSKSENNRQFTRFSYLLIGDAHIANLAYNEALQQYEQANQLSLNDNERAESYAKIAISHLGLKQLDQAIEFQRKCVVMQQKSGTPDDYAQASLLLGQYFSQNKEHANAEKIFQKLLKFSQDNGGAYYEAKTNVHLAQIKAAQGDQSAGASYLQQAKKIAHQLNIPALSQWVLDAEKDLQ